MKGTTKNKLAAIAFILVGILAAVFDRDGTILVIGLMVGIPLFLAKKPWIE